MFGGNESGTPYPPIPKSFRFWLADGAVCDYLLGLHGGIAQWLEQAAHNRNRAFLPEFAGVITYGHVADYESDMKYLSFPESSAMCSFFGGVVTKSGYKTEQAASLNLLYSAPLVAHDGGRPDSP